MNLDLQPWLLSRKITIADGVPTGSLDARWFGLMSLMIAHPPTADAAVAEKKE
jgi:hypothetical protein